MLEVADGDAFDGVDPFSQVLFPEGPLYEVEGFGILGARGPVGRLGEGKGDGVSEKVPALVGDWEILETALCLPDHSCVCMASAEDQDLTSGCGYGTSVHECHS